VYRLKEVPPEYMFPSGQMFEPDAYLPAFDGLVVVRVQKGDEVRDFYAILGPQWNPDAPITAPDNSWKEDEEDKD